MATAGCFSDCRFIDMIKMTEETGVLVFWQIWILSSYVHMKKMVKIQNFWFIKRDNITEDEANKRLNAQKPNKFYTSRCDYIILNDDHIKQMEKQLEKIPELNNITK